MSNEDIEGIILATEMLIVVISPVIKYDLSKCQKMGDSPLVLYSLVTKTYMVNITSFDW